MADVHASNQAAAASGGGGKGGGGDDGKRLVPPGKAHYNDDDSLEEIWSEIFNFSSGSAGMRKKHSRCVRCGREVGEHHRQNWQSQECTCVLCGTNGHTGKVCPLMEENREFFTVAWVKSALKGYRGVRKGELPPPLTPREVKSRRNAGFEEQRRENADAAAQTQQNVFNPMGMAMGQMASQMLIPMGMGMHMGMFIPMGIGIAPMPPFTPPAPTAFGGVAAPAAPQQQQSSNSSGRGGRDRRGGGRGGRGRRGRGGGRWVSDPLVDAALAHALTRPSGEDTDSDIDMPDALDAELDSDDQADEETGSGTRVLPRR